MVCFVALDNPYLNINKWEVEFQEGHIHENLAYPMAQIFMPQWLLRVMNIPNSREYFSLWRMVQLSFLYGRHFELLVN